MTIENGYTRFVCSCCSVMYLGIHSASLVFFYLSTLATVTEKLSVGVNASGSSVSTLEISSSLSPTSSLTRDTTKIPEFSNNYISSTAPEIIQTSSTSPGDMPFVTRSRFTPVVSSTPHDTVTNNPIEKSESIITIVLVISVFALLTIFLILIILIIMVKCHSRVKDKQGNQFQLENINQANSSQSQSSDPTPHDVTPVEISNPTYIRNKTAPPPSVTAGTGIYSEVTVDANGETVTKMATSDGQVFTGMYNLVAPLTPPVRSPDEIIESAAYACIQVMNSDKASAELDHNEDKKETPPSQPQSSAPGRERVYAVLSNATGEPGKEEGKKDTMTETAASDGQVFTGMYNLVTPLTPPVKSPSEIIDSAAYACVQVMNSNEASAELDHTGDEKERSLPQPQCSAQGMEGVYAALSDDMVGEPVERPRLYTDIQVREVPEVPTKSSDLLEDLDVEGESNVGIYSEPINHLDFTRNRMKGGTDDPHFLGPIYPLASALPEIYQDPAEITSGNITEKKKLRTGQFGEVVLANTNGLSLKTMSLSKTDDNPSISILVAVKKLQSNPSQTQREVFDKEVKFMSHIKHPNILRLLGVCHSDPAFILMEYTEGGDLNQFLQSYSEIVTTSSSQTQSTPSELVYIASQIASGMQYLAGLKFVHRDLATRNCFVTTNNSIKVGDYGANMSLYQSSYYRIRGNKMMPIRWMATECSSGKFSEKSDVWAFGVTMWELFTLAKDVPYPHLSDEEVFHNSLKREYRQFPVKPAACPQPVYEVMEKCWATDMRHRPTFRKIPTMLQF